MRHPWILFRLVRSVKTSVVQLPFFKVYKTLRRIHLRQSVKTRWARVKLFVLSGEKLLNTFSAVIQSHTSILEWEAYQRPVLRKSPTSSETQTSNSEIADLLVYQLSYPELMTIENEFRNMACNPQTTN